MNADVNSLGLSIKRIQARHHRLVDERLRPLGISLVQWDALRHLHENPDASLHDLAKLTFQTDQSCGALTSRMIERGIIERQPANGRAVRHRLTPLGDQLRRDAGELVRDVLEQSFAPLTEPKREQLGQLLTLMLEVNTAR